MGFLSSVFGYLLNCLYVFFSNYGIAIIVFSILLRIILIPITIKQQKSMKKSAKIQQKLAEIQNKYRNNPERLNQETIELYKKEKTSPFSGCLSGILQLLILLSVFWLVSQPLTYMIKVENNEDLKNIVEEYKEEINNSESKGTYIEIQVISKIEEEYKEILNKLNSIENGENIIINNEELDENQIVEKVQTKEELESRKEKLEKLRINMEFLGLDLSKVPNQNLNDWRVYVIPLLYVITSFASIKLTTITQNKKKKKDDLIIVGEENKEEINTDQIGQMSNTMMYMMPIMSISIAIIAPLGLALYWLTSNILMIIEKLVIDKVIISKEDEQDAE